MSKLRKVTRKLFSVCTAIICAVTFMLPALEGGITTASAATYTYTNFPTSDTLIKTAAALLGTKYTFGYKGCNSVYTDGKYSLQSVDTIRSKGIDCSGLVYYTLTKVGYTMSGFEYCNPNPVNTIHWLYGVENQSRINNLKISYKGISSSIDVEKVKLPTPSSTTSGTKYEYWQCADGKVITPGSIVVADKPGTSVNHAWIYIGEFDSREKVIEYLKAIGVPSSLITSKTVVSKGNCKHWRIESNGDEGVVINNGTDGKNTSALTMSAFRVTPDPTFSFEKRNVETGNLIGKSTIDGTTATYGIYSDAACTKLVKTITIDANGRALVQLENDDYWLKEIKAPTGYQLSTTVHKISSFFVNVDKEVFDGGNATITKYVDPADNSANYVATSTANATINSKVRFKIKDTATGHWVNAVKNSTGNYTYTRSDATATGATFALGTDGKFTIKDLPARKYTLIETSTIAGYTNSADVNFTVTYNKTASVSAINSEDKGNAHIYKYGKDIAGDVYKATSSLNSELNSAVRFKIKNAAGKYVTADATSTAGKYIYSGANSTGTSFPVNTNAHLYVVNLPVGTYTLVETATAAGYEKSADVKFTVTKGEASTTNVTNTERGELVVTKKINNGTSTLNVTDYEYSYVDGGGNTKILTWNNLRSTIRFKLKAPNGQYVTVKRLGDSGSGNFVYNGTSADGSLLYLSYDNSIAEAVTVGTLKVANLPDGNYTLVEVENPLAATDDRYYTFAQLGVTTSKNVAVTIKKGTRTSKTVTNKVKSLGDLTIDKIISLSDNAEPTAEMYAAVSFKLKNSTGSYITLNTVNTATGAYTYSGTVTAEGNATEIKLGTDTLTSTIKSLPLGDYTVIENVDDKFEAQSNNLGATVTNADEATVTFYNIEKTGKILVQKRTEGDLNLEGIGFTLSGTSDSGREISKYGTTDASGELSFENIPIGRYTITENGDTVPTAYLVAEPQSVDVIYNKTITKTFDNIEKTGSIKVVKRTEGNYNVSGIEFILSGTSDSGREIEIKATTDATGEATFTGVPIGTYTITENGDTVPTAYLVAEPQSVAVVYNQTTDVTFNNVEKYGEILVQKRTEGDFNIANIGFTLSGTSDSGREISVYGTTDETGKVSFTVPIGTYTITEDGDTVPTAYLVAEPQSVDVIYNQTTNVTFDNLEKYGEILVQKRTEGDFNIANIGFTLSGTSDSGREISVYGTTDETGKVSFTVPIGTYTITEDASTVHYAYLVAEPQEVTIVYSEQVTQEIYNAERTGYLEVQKETLGMVNIEGIRFVLSGISESGREINAIGVTDATGLAGFFIVDENGEYALDENGNKIPNIPIGTYVITEDGDTVPTAYLVADPWDVKIDYAQTVKSSAYNAGSGTFHFTKSDISDGKLIPNCEIAIYDENGNVVVSGKTDKNGVIEFTLPEGKYYYQEIKAPDGYLIDNGKYEFVIEAGKITKAEMTNEKVPEDDTPNTSGGTADCLNYGSLFIIVALGIVCVLAKRGRKDN